MRGAMSLVPLYALMALTGINVFFLSFLSNFTNVRSVQPVNHLQDPGVNERIILRWIFEKLDGGAWTRSIWLRIGAGDGLL
jgi:hypothetical protein